MVSDYTFYLMAYGQGGGSGAAVIEQGNAPPTSEAQLAAHALGLSDARNAFEPRSKARIDADVAEMCGRPKAPTSTRVNVGDVDLAALKADVDRLIAATKAINAPKSVTVESANQPAARVRALIVSSSAVKKPPPGVPLDAHELTLYTLGSFDFGKFAGRETFLVAGDAAPRAKSGELSKSAAAQRARDEGRAFLAAQIPPVSRTGPGAEQVVAGLVLALDDLLGP